MGGRPSRSETRRTEDHPLCATCGVQADAAVDTCPICADERQYVGWEGQAWTTTQGLLDDGFRNEIDEVEPGLWGIRIEPPFAIGQRSLLIRTDDGNMLWDPASLVDETTVRKIEALGGIHAISASHPHFYGAIGDWSRAFGDAPIFLPNADRSWIQRTGVRYEFYEEAVAPLPSLTLVRCGGHFEGSALLHWPKGAGGNGALLAGDTVQVVMDRRAVSFMRSYPNLIPLGGNAVRTIVARLNRLEYDRIYSGFRGRNIESGAAKAVETSTRRYIEWIGDTEPDL